MNSKELLREEYKIVRKKIDLKKNKDNIIYSKIVQNENVKNSDTILIYYSIKEEVDTVSLIQYFLSNKKKVALPKVVGKKISFYYIENLLDVKIGKYNILEPISSKEVNDFLNSVCIVPGICFDKNNYRIGYGGGYYDRFLENYIGYSIGITYQECLVESIKIDFYDQEVNEVITD